MTVTTLRELHSEQSALQAACAAYAELRDHLIAFSDERARRVIERAYDRGAATLEALFEHASDAPLSDADQELLEMFLASMRSDDEEQLQMWLGLLPESLERMIVTAAEEHSQLGAVAEEPAWYEVTDETKFTFEPRETRPYREHARQWGQPAAV